MGVAKRSEFRNTSPQFYLWGVEKFEDFRNTFAKMPAIDNLPTHGALDLMNRQFSPEENGRRRCQSHESRKRLLNRR